MKQKKSSELPSTQYHCSSLLYIYHFSTVGDFSNEKLSTVVLLDRGTPGTSREIYSEDSVYFSDEKSTTVEKL